MKQQLKSGRQRTLVTLVPSIFLGLTLLASGSGKVLEQGDDKCVGELSQELNKKQSLISLHLNVLKECNIGRDRQEARRVYYRLGNDRLARIVLKSEALMKELSLCRCQEVNYEKEGN